MSRHRLGAVDLPGSLTRRLPDVATATTTPIRVPIGRSSSIACAIAFVGLILLLPVARELTKQHGVEILDSFYRSGALVFGGGHVVLPLLEEQVVASGWISNEGFLAGYGAAQAVPGPLFTFAAYLGAAMTPSPSGWAGLGNGEGKADGPRPQDAAVNHCSVPRISRAERPSRSCAGRGANQRGERSASSRSVSWP